MYVVAKAVHVHPDDSPRQVGHPLRFVVWLSNPDKIIGRQDVA